MTPLILAAVGEIITEKAGVVNIGIEGTMLFSAFLATWVTFFTENPILGVLTGIMLGGLLGLIHGVISTYLRGDQIIAGIGLNILAYGATAVGLISVWGNFGSSPFVVKVPKIIIHNRYISPITLSSLPIAVIFWWILHKTTIGLKIRACGENPHAAEAMGVNIWLVRLGSTIIGGFMNGLAGAYISVDLVGQFSRGITAGRGFIALANVVFSNWNPILSILGGFVFGFFDALAAYLDIMVQDITLTYIFKIIPYVSTLTVVAVFIGKSRPPADLGKPYFKE